MAERIPPHNKEAEQSTLGACMLSKDALSEISDIVVDNDFYDAAHSEIYKAIINLFKENVSVDIVTVCDELKKRGTLETAGGRAYIVSLPAGVPSASGAVGYARIVSVLKIKIIKL